jgi:hypothetical protein
VFELTFTEFLEFLLIFRADVKRVEEAEGGGNSWIILIIMIIFTYMENFS